ncbi:MAG: hypothetical protein AABW64_02935 [Nanoarchaeota archaeon]
MKPSANYVLLEAKQHGSYLYPDIYVCLDRLACTPALRRSGLLFDLLGEEEEIELGNFASDLNGKGFIGNIDYGLAMNLVQSLPGHSFPLNLRLAIDYSKIIRSGAKGKNVFDAAGNRISRQRLSDAWKDLTHNTPLQEPRTEWINGVYEKDAPGKMHVHYLLPKFNGDLVNIIEPLEACLMTDRMIDFNDWINNATSQGLPQRNVRGGTSFYIFPHHQSVARFGAYTTKGLAHVGLNCISHQTGYALGVRVAKIKVE